MNKIISCTQEGAPSFLNLEHALCVLIVGENKIKVFFPTTEMLCDISEKDIDLISSPSNTSAWRVISTKDSLTATVNFSLVSVATLSNNILILKGERFKDLKVSIKKTNESKEDAKYYVLHPQISGNGGTMGAAVLKVLDAKELKAFLEEDPYTTLFKETADYERFNNSRLSYLRICTSKKLSSCIYIYDPLDMIWIEQ